MNKKILFISIGIFVVLLAGILIFNTTNNESAVTNKISDRDFISKLRETSSTEELTYEKVSYTKDYYAEDRRLLIESDKGEAVLDIKLTSPYIVKNLVAGNDVKVAEFFLIDWDEDRDTLFNGVDYFDVNNGYKEVSKTFKYKWANESEECIEEENKCYTQIRWVEFETLDELPHKNIRIGAFTQTIVNEKIEFVPSINGFEILEWARWDIGSASIVGEFDVSGEQTTPRGVFLGKNGTKLYVAGTVPVTITEYNLTIANNISTAVFSTSVVLPIAGLGSIFWQSNGSRFYACGATNAISEYSLGDSWLINKTLFPSSGSMTLTQLGDCRGIYIRSNGHDIYSADSVTKMAQYTLTDNWNINTGSINGSFVSTPWQTETAGLSMAIDGSKIFTSGNDFNTISEVDLSIPFNIQTASHFQNISSGIASTFGVFVDDAGSTMLVVDNTNDKIIQYFMSLAPKVTLNKPDDNAIFSTEQVDINCSATDAITLNNISLYIDGVQNTSISAIGVQDELNITLNFADGNHNWTCSATNNENFIGFATNRTFTVDTIAPEVNITQPFDPINYTITGNNLTINWTVSDATLDSCWGSFDGGINNVTLTCGDLNITRNITSFTNDTFTFWANDTVGNVGVISRTWVYKVFEVKQVFSSETLVGSTETFVMNMSLGLGETIQQVTFNYNGTDHSATAVNLGGREYNISSTFVIPLVPAIVNMSFFWRIDLSSEQINTTAKNQTVNVISIDDCSSFSNLIFNYTLIDEETQNRIDNTTANGTKIELDITIFDQTKTTNLVNFSQEFTDTNPVHVCLSVSMTESTIYAVDSTVKYEAVNYSIEYYNIQNFLMRNLTIPQQINLFDLKLVDATEFQITFKDSDFVVVENALIQINRQYVSEGAFKTVEIPKTDSNGQTVAHLVEKEVVYNMIVLKEGVILGTFNNVIAFCEDIIIGSCFIALNALTAGESPFEYDEDIELFYDFDYNESTRNLQFNFVTTDGSSKNVTLISTKIDQLGDTSVCSSFLISSSGTISCPVPISVGNETIVVSIFVDGDLKIENYIRAGRSFDIGDSGYFLMFFLVLSLALMFTGSKTGVIIGVLIGFIAGSLLSFISGGILEIGSSIIWLIIMGVILIYKLNSQGAT